MQNYIAFPPLLVQFFLIICAYRAIELIQYSLIPYLFQKINKKYPFYLFFSPPADCLFFHRFQEIYVTNKSNTANQRVFFFFVYYRMIMEGNIGKGSILECYILEFIADNLTISINAWVLIYLAIIMIQTYICPILFI